jgi:DNA-binding MarR family transcriptional regulator
LRTTAALERAPEERRGTVHGSGYAGKSKAAAVETSSRELADELAAAVVRLRRALRRATRRDLPFEPLPRNQIDLLRLAAERPRLSVAAAAAALSLAPNTVSTLVNALCRAGLLARAADDADRRVARLSPTAAGLDRMAAWRDHRAEVLSASLGDLAPADRALLRSGLPALERLIEALERLEGAER